MLKIVLYAVACKLALDGIAGASHSRSVGAAALDHETGDDPVEDQAVIETVACEFYEVIDRDGGDVGIKFSLDDSSILH